MILKIDVFDLNITLGPLNVMKSGQNHITDIADITVRHFCYYRFT